VAAPLVALPALLLTTQRNTAPLSEAAAEAMVKVAELLSDKIDRVSVAVNEGYGNDVQVVVDRMSEAIQAMSGRGRRRDAPEQLGA
jgi:hypothetical protein